ncbi:DUF748 domain-containing protein [Methylomarinum vadi]|uniref:DUF748 domain-containing protein n=1 Tax=Methylomarinum vadi TaxID=438855 RepID=UPI000690F378|nr:DUF748 domain-containing protein [Methylomarinum vadi]
MGKLTLSSRNKIVLLSLTGVILLYALAGFLVFPAVLSHQIPKLAQEKLHRSASVDDIHFNPFSLEFSVDGFTLTSRDESPFASFGQFYVNLNMWRSIIDLTLTFDQIKLSQPYVFVERDRKGDFNFSDLLNQKQSPDEENQSNNGEMFPVTLEQVTIAQGKLTWEDNFYPQSQREDIYPLDLTLHNLTTRLDGQSQLGFSLMFASGGSFTWQGTLGLNPLFSDGNITLEKVSFRRVWELFLKNAVQFEIQKGSELIEAEYHLRDGTTGPRLLIDNAQVEIYDVKISEKAQPDVLIDIPDFKLSGINANLADKTVKITDISANDAAFKARLNADGSINYQSLFKMGGEQKQTTAATKPTAGKEQPWSVIIDRLAMENFALRFVDNTLPRPATIALSNIDFKSQDLSSEAGATVPLNLSLTVNDGGKISLTGETSLEPFQADLRFKADAIALKDFQPYADKAAKLDILSGLFSADTHIALLQQDKQELAITLQGDSRISDFASKDRISNQDFLKWGELSLQQMNFDIAGNSYSIDNITLKQPYARVLIKQDKSLNVNDVIVAKPATEQTAAAQTEAEKPRQPAPTFKIGRIDISGGESDFADLSLIMPFSAYLNRLQGSIDSISTARNDITRIKLAGKVDDLAPVKIEGQISPYKGDSEFALDFNSMPMPLITPYMAQFAGRKIEKGNFTLGLRYKIQNRQLTASNKLLIEHLVLGDKVENPKAVSLPLNLAIALLEDSNGKIALDVPITGSLEDPKFSVASIVDDALVNVITKIVSSPFNAIASLIEGGKDISNIAFPAGQATLIEDQRHKLDELAVALKKRPKLQLEIKGAAFSRLDWPSLQQETLRTQLQQRRADELNRENQTNLAAKDIRLSEEDYQRLLADLFIKNYPNLNERSFFGTPRLLDPKMGDFYAVAERKLAADIPPDPERLAQLANSRAQAIAKYLIAKGIAVNRIFMLDASVDTKNSAEEATSTLNLTVN